jgi:NADH:ubiquinone oxidoreductase subunit K
VLIAVMAIIFFSISENANQKSRPEVLLLLVLSIVTVVANGVALSAILFRIAQWGFSPNRTAVFGANVLILVHLLLVTVNLFGVVIKKADIQTVGKTIAQYLPVYFVWCTVVTFIFPFLFGLK